MFNMLWKPNYSFFWELLLNGKFLDHFLVEFFRLLPRYFLPKILKQQRYSMANFSFLVPSLGFDNQVTDGPAKESLYWF